MLNNRLVSELIRQRLNLPDDSQAARILNLTPQALKNFGRKAAADPFTRSILTSALGTATAAISATGSVDLTAVTFAPLIEYVDLGQVYLLPAIVATVTANATGSVTVTDAGTAAANDDYDVDGYENGRIRYQAGSNLIKWTGNAWVFGVDGPELVVWYSSDENVNTPQEVTEWTVVTGDLPLPVLTSDGGSINIVSDFDTLQDLDRVQFTSIGSLPTGISALTNYYIVAYIVDELTGFANFLLSSTADGSGFISPSTTGTGTLTMTKMNAGGIPLRKVPVQTAPISQYLSNVFNSYYIQGNTLQLLPIAGVVPAGTLAFSVPTYPTSVTLVPQELEAMFLDKLTELVLMPGNDSAQDLDR